MNEPEPTPKQMTREEFDLLTFQGIDPVTHEAGPSSAEIEKEKDRQSRHEFRVFLVFGVPVGLVLALIISLSTGMGDVGFFAAWGGCTLISGLVFSSILPRQPRR